jgi:transposase-like protein
VGGFDMPMSKKEFEDLNNKEKLLGEAAKILSVEEKDLLRVINRFLREVDEMSSERSNSK